MNAAARIGAFVSLLVLVFAAAAFAGSKIDPGVDEPSSEMEMEGTEMKMEEHTQNAPTAEVPGLAVASGGYDLSLPETILQPNASTEFEFSILDQEGATVREFDSSHERRMHLIVVRRDFQAFQHLHPEQRPDGSWTATMDSRLPGVYRAFADFSTGGESLTLAADLFVPGQFDPQPLAPVSTTADAGDGYEVSLESPAAGAGDTVGAEFTVTLDGEPIGELQPYLGADGHLVALRQGDQAFLHTHPEGEPGGAGPIRFQVSYPSAGRYRLYLQFRHENRIHTAEFTREVAPAGQTDTPAGHEGSSGESHGH
ncbi:MAG TPA: hypothetical protein VMF31_04805 [Solirubrobacterales bacterium]|nr:hypothetical protein [Solirubrobacterales bacterium]